MVKGVVDVEKGILCIDAELHADIESYLLERGSKQDNLWGINIYPEIEGDDFLEFDSLINIRPRQNNRSRGVEDETIQEKIRNIINNKIKWYNTRNWQKGVGRKFERALELIDITLTTNLRRTALIELCRIRENLCEEYFKPDTKGIEQLNKYLFQFALVKRKLKTN